MREQSPYEGFLDDLGGKIALGQVVSLNTNPDGTYDRTARVKTLGNKMHGTDDQDLQNVKIMHFQWNPDGTYAVAMPMVGSYYLVAYINSEPVLLSAYPLSNSEGPTVANGQPPGRPNQTDNLAPGDYAFVTALGARVIIRSGGTVEVEATKNCRTYWLPTKETITTVCQNKEMSAGAGYENWTVDPKSGVALKSTQVYDNIAPTQIVQTQVGTPDAGGIFDMQIGAAADDLTVSAPTFKLNLETDGTLTLLAAGIKAKLTSSTMAVGTDSVELLKQISDFLQKVADWAANTGATHTHLGNLGAPTSPPQQASEYIQLQSDLLKIKQLIDSIRGTL